jgi:integrase
MLGCRPLDKREIEQALGALKGSRVLERNRCLFLMGIYSGFRISELLSLRIWDVVQYGRVLDRVKVARKSMKGKKRSRTVAMTYKAKKALAAWLPLLYRWRGPIPDTYVFQSNKGAAITRQHAARIMRELAHRFGWPPAIGTHSLRKTFAKSIYNEACKRWRPGQEIPVRKVMKALGHKSPGTTEQYLGLEEAEVDELVLALDYGE